MFIRINLSQSCYPWSRRWVRLVYSALQISRLSTSTAAPDRPKPPGQGIMRTWDHEFPNHSVSCRRLHTGSTDRPQNTIKPRPLSHLLASFSFFSPSFNNLNFNFLSFFPLHHSTHPTSTSSLSSRPSLLIGQRDLTVLPLPTAINNPPHHHPEQLWQTVWPRADRSKSAPKNSKHQFW